MVAKSGELAVDPPVSPGRILCGQADDQRAYADGDGGSTGPGGLGSPAAGDELSVPAQDRGRCDDQPAAQPDG